MGGDYTRISFDPWDDFSSLLMQQGRVQLDQDWNGMADILRRRWQSETVDVVGRCAFPRTAVHGPGTPGPFQISASGGGLTIGVGRAYVDGLQPENHGKHGPQDPLEIDGVLDELRGNAPIAYAEQPYYPKDVQPNLPTGAGPHLVYLDLWEREVTFVERPELVERALGFDTSTRLQTAWQVKVLPNVGQIKCDTPGAQIPGWNDATRASAGRLSTDGKGTPQATDPCTIPPTGGYRGTENRLYRVEIHKGGTEGQATFKWSRDDGSVATIIMALNSGRDELTVGSTGRDAVLRFSKDDWVEVTDDWRELTGQAGEMRKVQSIDDSAGKILLTAALPAGAFDPTKAERHTRVRRWDQKGVVYDEANNQIGDVDTNGGVIKVPAATTPAVQVALEKGIVVTFNTEPAGGRFKVGDFWVFAARTVDSSVEKLRRAPPRGVHHHYCRLAVVTFPSTATDCRTLWPPEAGAGGCDCTVCVSAESHNSGTLTIQKAIDEVLAQGGTVCLGPGVYNLGQTPLMMMAANSLHLRGQGWTTALLYLGEGPALTVQRSFEVTISDLAIFSAGRSEPSPSAAGAASPTVALVNCVATTIERCAVARLGAMRAQTRTRSTTSEAHASSVGATGTATWWGSAAGAGLTGGAAIGLGGFQLQVEIRENLLLGTRGVSSIGAPMGQAPTRTATTAAAVVTYDFLLIANLRIRDNVIAAVRRAVSIDGLALQVGDCRIAGNLVIGCVDAGVVSAGVMLDLLSKDTRLDGRVDILSNQLNVVGHGVVVSSDRTRVVDNDIAGLISARHSAGVVVTGGLLRGMLQDCQILDNRIRGVGGDGIALGRNQLDPQSTERLLIARAVIIKNNQIEGVGGNGIAMDSSARATGLSVHNNQLTGMGLAADSKTPSVMGIRVARATLAEISSNTVAGVGSSSQPGPRLRGLQAIACPSVRVSGNQIVDLGPPNDVLFQDAVGIEVLLVLDHVDVQDNTVRRAQGNFPEKPDQGAWRALNVGAIPTQLVGIGTAAQPIMVEATLAGKPVHYVHLAGNLYTLVKGTVHVLPRGKEFISVRGNLLESFGGRTPVEIGTAGGCQFIDNRCFHTSTQGTSTVPAPPAAEITAGAMIVSGNYVEGPARATTAVALNTFGTGAPYTIVGNITSGEIAVDGQQLSQMGAPWAPLNVLTP